MSSYEIVICVFSALLCLVSSSELTFELEDKARQCFHEFIEKGVLCIVEFQVVTGGNYDVDLFIEAPNRQILYKVEKSQYDTFTWTTAQKGVYTVCFSNEFSSFAHKLVYLDFQVGDEKPIVDDDERSKALTMIESSMVDIHTSMRDVIDYQTHHRLREAQGRKRAEDINARVQWWSLGQSIVILFVMIGQVIILKSFFSDKKTLSISSSR